MKSKLLLAAAPLIVGVAAPVQAQTLTNGGFEAPVVSDSCCDTVVVPNSFPGWTVTAGDINIVNGTFGSTNGNLAYQGNQYLDLVGQAGTGAIAQAFSTVQGRTYELTFAYSHNVFSAVAASATFAISGATGLGSAGAVSHSAGSSNNLDWRVFSGRFLATGTNSTLNFTNTAGTQNGGLFLDAVSITGVPEASTWAMMIIGFGAVGGVMRRRTATRVAYA